MFLRVGAESCGALLSAILQSLTGRTTRGGRSTLGFRVVRFAISMLLLSVVQLLDAAASHSPKAVALQHDTSSGVRSARGLKTSTYLCGYLVPRQ